MHLLFIPHLSSYICSIKILLFLSGDMVGLPKSFLEPMAHFTSINDNLRCVVTSRQTSSNSSIVCTEDIYSYPQALAILVKSIVDAAVGIPPTDSCA